MKLTTQLLMAAVVAGATQMASAADITGKITLKGTPPPEKELPLDPSCGKLHTAKPKTRFYVVDAKGGLADTFVYIKEGLTAKPDASAQAAVLDQKGCEYVPYVFGLQTKQKLSVKNSDPLMHNVHATPDPKSGNKESNMAQMPGPKMLDYTFNNPEVFLRFKCDVHPWMFAYAGVVDHPYFAVSGADGSFKIPNVPPGKYVVEIVHRKTHATAKPISKEVTVGADGAKLDVTIEVAAQ